MVYPVKGGTVRAAIWLLPVVAALVAALALLWSTIEERDRFQIDAARASAEQALTAFVEFARSQSAAFASTSVIGYSIGRYYGFAPAFAEISPDPERAAAMLRKYFAENQPGQPAEMPQALAAYMGVHDRFHPSFENLIDSTPFEDLYLVNHAGQVVYSLRKDTLFAADLTEPRFRDTPLAAAYREVLAMRQRSADPQKILFVSGLVRLADGYGALLARPVIRHDVVEGVVVFRMKAATIEQPLAALRQPGIRVELLDGDGHPIGAAGTAGRQYGPFVLDGIGWRYLIVAEPATLAGTWWYWFVALSAASVIAVAVSLRWIARGAAAALADSLPPTDSAALAPPVPAAPAEPVEAHDEPPDHGQQIDAHLEADEGFRRSIVEVMTLALDYWQKTKRKGKIELAEESGLWRVYMDRSSLQTRTLDKYLLVETLPRNPRWRDVVRTAEYVLRNAADPIPERDALAQALAALKQYLRQVERI
jgi:hypothetical protein